MFHKFEERNWEEERVISSKEGWLPLRPSQIYFDYTNHTRAFLFIHRQRSFVFAGFLLRPVPLPRPSHRKSLGAARVVAVTPHRSLRALPPCAGDSADSEFASWRGVFEVYLGGLGFPLALGFCREGGKSDTPYHF